MRSVRLRRYRVILAFMLVLMLLPSSVASAAATPQAPQPAAPVVLPQESVTEQSAEPSSVAPVGDNETLWAKLHPDLQELARTQGPALSLEEGAQVMQVQEPVWVQVYARVASEGAGTLMGEQLSSYFVDGGVVTRSPLDMEDESWLSISFGRILPSNLLKVASLDDVEAITPVVLERNGEPDPYPADDLQAPLPTADADTWAQLRAQADALREGSLSWAEAEALGGESSAGLMDWFESDYDGPYDVADAWADGYTGEGVAVAVLDDGVDFAHPDLLGTYQIYSSTSEFSRDYNGWPMAFSPFSMLLYAFDAELHTTFTADGYTGSGYVDTSTTPTLTACGPGAKCFEYTPLLDYDVPGIEHTYIISSTMTKSGVVHVGTHPDVDLRDYVWGEKVAVLVCDPNTAGVYDTVYVDLNDDYDFRDEKPVTRAQLNSVTGEWENVNGPVSYRSMNADDLPDLSGGAVYFVADGETPIPMSYIYDKDGLVPDNGDLVAFTGGSFGYDYSHGTQCASNIVGQGYSSGMLPSFGYGLKKSKVWTPDAAVVGVAPDARIVDVSDIYWNVESSILDAYLFVVYGYDRFEAANPGDTDAIQIASNSYGFSEQDNDGWDYEGQLISQFMRYDAPSTQFLFSTGNGGPGYGTAAPPSPDLGIAVGASTEFDSTGWDSITSTEQIMYGDVIPFSNRGPSARGTTGVDVVAGGAYAAGAEALNYYSISKWGRLDGDVSWSTWGGTSRSTPVAAGVLALIYQAYKEAHGVWPSNAVAKALLMSSATDLDYDVFTQGAGMVNAARGVELASGEYGLLVQSEDGGYDWVPGEYRGEDYPGFAHITYPGDTYTQTFTITNTDDYTVTASVDATELKLISSQEFTFTVTPDMIAAESVYGEDNRDNFYKAFNFFIPITATSGMDPSWYAVDIPENTELMVVRQILPYDNFDVDGDYSWDQRFYLTVYNWMDLNSDGDVWEDLDSNGVVNFINSGIISQIDGAEELQWTDPRNELDRWEYGRFGYNRPASNTSELWIQNPVERMFSGLFIGVRHLYTSAAEDLTTDIRYRIDFYAKEDVPWLTVLGDDTPTLWPESAVTVTAQVSVPLAMPAGAYEAAIEVDDGEGHTSVVPVVLNVAADIHAGKLTGFLPSSVQLAGEASYLYDQGRLYNNASVRGQYDWTWREESGDWRTFFVDATSTVTETRPVTGPLPYLLVQDEWDDAAPHTDIDTIILGPTESQMGEGSYSDSEPSYYGPYILDQVGGSQSTVVDRATWLFDTSSGVNLEQVTAPLRDGLHALLEHNVLYEGDKFDVVYTKTVGVLMAEPYSYTIDTYLDEGKVGDYVLTSTLALSGVVADAYGLGAPELRQGLELPDEAGLDWVDFIEIEHGALIELWTSSAIADIDLYLYYCGPTGSGPCEQRGSSASSGSDEYIQVLMPEDGLWAIGVDNYSGPAGTFDLYQNVVQGNDLSVEGLPGGAISANTPVTFTVRYDRDMEVNTSYAGLLLVGTPEGPALLRVPITINRVEESADIEKTVSAATAMQLDVLTYTVSLYNLSDAAAVFTMTDPLPANTEFVTVTNAQFDPIGNQVVFSGTLPLSVADAPSRVVTVTVSISGTALSGSWITNTATMTATHLLPQETQVEEAVSADAGTQLLDTGITAYMLASPKVVAPGIITYEVHITNTGDRTVDVVFRDYVPVGVEIDSWDPQMYYSLELGVGWDGALRVGEEKVLTFQVRTLPFIRPGDLTNTATLAWDGYEDDLEATTRVWVVGARLPMVMRP